MTKRTRITLVVACWTVAVLVLCGCKSSPGHKKAMSEAEANYLRARSNMLLQMAQQEFDTGDLDQATRHIKDALGADSRNGSLWVLSGRIALEKGQLERAFRRLHMAIELDDQLADAHYYQAVVLERWQRHENALEEYQSAYDLVRDNPYYLLAISEMLVTLERQDEALALLEDKLIYFDQNAGIRLAVARLYQMRGQTDQAVQQFKEAALLRPDDLQMQEELACALIAVGEARQGIRKLEELVRQPENQGRRDLRFTLAAAYVQASRLNDAKRLYGKLTTEDPKNAMGWIRLGETAWAMQDAPGALAAAKRGIAADPGRHEGYLLAGMVYHQWRHLTPALQMFDRAAELSPDDAMPLVLRGITLQQAGDDPAAAKAYAEALRRQPDNTRARQLLASVTRPAGS